MNLEVIQQGLVISIGRGLQQEPKTRDSGEKIGIERCAYPSHILLHNNPYDTRGELPDLGPCGYTGTRPMGTDRGSVGIPAANSIAVAGGGIVWQDFFLLGWVVIFLQALFLIFGQREAVHGLVDGRDQLGVNRGKGGVGDVPAPESAADDHAEGVGVDVPDVGGGFDDAASDEAGPLLDQLGRAESVGENVVVQTRDTTEPIDRDGTDFV